MTHKLTRLLSLMLAVIMTFSMLLIPVEAASFNDVSDQAWYKAAVDYVHERGWMAGTSEYTFEPTVDVTRGMFVTVLARFAEAKTDNDQPAFADTPAGKWYTGAAAWAAKEGVVSGIGANSFAPNRPITRQDLCTVLAAYLRVKGIELTRTQEKSFTDEAAIASYAKDPVALCAAVGLIAGFDDGSFRPKQTATRAQLAQIIMRLDLLLRGEEAPTDPMPAQSFAAEQAGDMTVSVEAPQGALPENTTMSVSPVTDEAALADISAKTGAKVYAAADITFFKDNEKLEPEKEVEVQIELDGLDQIKNPTVVHVRADGSVEPVNAELISANRSGSEKALRFYARDFSVYAIGDGGNTVNTLTVEFYSKDGKIISGQTIRLDQLDEYITKNMDYVHDPGVPEITSTQSFEGWARVPDGTELAAFDYSEENEANYGFSVQEINDAIKAEKETLKSASGNVTWRYCAKVFDVIFITYHDQGGVVIRLESVHLDDSTKKTEYEVNLSYSPFQGGWAHMGWTRVINNTGDEPTYPENPVYYENGETIENLSSSIDLYPYLKQGYWLVFDNYIDQDLDDTSASFTSPKYYGKDEAVSEPTDYGDSNNDGVDHDTAPYRVGYTFGGWYTKPQEVRATDNNGKPLYTGLDGKPTTESTQVNNNGKTVQLKERMVADWDTAERYQWDRKLEAETTVYARWIPNEGSYLVVYMVQNASDKNDNDVTNNTYSYYDSVRRDWLWKDNNKTSSKVGEYVSAFTATSVTENDTYLGTGKLTAGRYYSKDIAALGQYFKYSDKNDGVSVMIDGDGSTVLYVYYDRKPVTFKFYRPNYESATESEIYGNTNRQYFCKVGDTYLPLTYDLESSYHYWYYTGYTWRYRNGSWSGKNRSASSYSTLSSSPTFYYVSNYTLQKESTQLYGHVCSADDQPALVEPECWYINGYGDDGIILEKQSYFTVPSQYSGSNKNEVEFYHGYYFQDDEKKTLHFITQDSETGAWGTKWFTTEIENDGYLHMFEDDIGHTLYGFNVYTPSSLTTDPAIDSNFHSRPSDGIVALIYTSSSASGVSQGITYYRMYDDAYIFYTLNTNKLVFRSKTGVVKEETLRYGQSLKRFGHVDNDLSKAEFVPNDGGNGYFFDGWYTDESYMVPFDFNSTMPDEPVTLYAKWTKMRFRVFLDYTGGDSDADVEFPANQASTFRVDYGEKVRDSAVMAAYRDGYTLLGWYLDKEGEHPFNFGEAITDKTLNLDRSYVYGTGRTGTDPVNGKAYTDDDVDANGNPIHDNVIGKLTIYALWRKNSVGSDGIRVRYDAIEGDGYFPVNNEKTDPRMVIRDDPNVYTDAAKAFVQVASTPEDDENYRFLYWVVMQPVKDSQGKQLFNEDGTPKLEKTQIKVYPGQTFTVDYNYTVQTDAYKITWKYCKADGSWIQETTTVTAGAVPNRSRPSGYLRENLYYPVTGWTDGTNTYSYDEDGNVTLPAATANTEYTAVYGAGQEPTDLEFLITWKNYDGSVLKTEYVKVGETPSYNGTPTRPSDDDNDYTFEGWTPEVAAVTGDATYTATFRAVTRSFTITFHANGGKFSDSSETYVKANVTKGTLFKDIVPTNPTNSTSGRYFYGWFTAATGGTAITSTDDVDGTITDLYAHWGYWTDYTLDTSGKLIPGDYYVFYSDSNAVSAKGATNIYGTTISGYDVSGFAASAVANGQEWCARTSTSGGILLVAYYSGTYYYLSYSSGYAYGDSSSGYHVELVSAGSNRYYLRMADNTNYYLYRNSATQYSWSMTNETAFYVYHQTAKDLNAGSGSQSVIVPKSGELNRDFVKPTEPAAASRLNAATVAPAPAAPDATRSNTQPVKAATTNTLLTEGFESLTLTKTNTATDALGSGWTVYNGNNIATTSDHGWWSANQLGSSNTHGGDYAAGYYYDSSYAADCYLISPAFTVSSNATNVDLQLFAKVAGAAYPEKFEAYFVDASLITTTGGVKTAAVGSGKYASIAETTSSSTAWVEYNGTPVTGLAGKSVRLVVRACSDADKYYLYVDDITVTETVDDSGTGGETNTDVWVETDKIKPGEEYLIGVEYNNKVYLLMNYNPSQTNNYWYVYTDSNSEKWYFGYLGIATRDANEKVTAVTGDSTDFNHFTWKFSSTTGGTVTSCQDSNLYLYGADGPVPYTSATEYIWDAANHALYENYTSNGETKKYYVSLVLVDDIYYSYERETQLSGASVRLYKKYVEDTTPSYTITWNYRDENGGEASDTTSVKEGETPVAPENVPKSYTKDGVTYTRTGWTPAPAAVTGDATYTAVYAQTAYEITWSYRSSEGTEVSQTVTVDAGTEPTAPTVPESYTTEDGTTYTITGWNPTVAAATAVATYEARYNVTSYTITWNYKTPDGSSTSVTTTAAPGEIPDPGFTPAAYTSDDEEEDYRFKGWSTEENGKIADLVAASGPATYYAVYTNQTYQITWHTRTDGGEWTAVTVVVAEGAVPRHSKHPIWTDSNGVDWQFTGWAASEEGEALATLPAASENTEYWAKYTEVGTYTYTMYLYAVYGLYNKSGTHVTWFGNNDPSGATAGLQTQRDRGMQINVGYDIPTPETFYNGAVDHDADAPAALDNAKKGLYYEDHVFLGWARLESDPNDTANAGAAHPELTEKDLYLKYDAATNSYYLNDGVDAEGNTKWTTASYSKIAADEMSPYHDMYAVWSGYYYVFHSATGELEALEVPSGNGTQSLVELVKPGYLYGGYYSQYGGASAITAEQLRAFKDRAMAKRGLSERLVSTSAETYDGSSLKTTGLTANVRYWKTANAYKAEDGADRGDALKPTAGTVYYVKEVPSQYLSTRAQWVTDGNNEDALIYLYLLTVTDDTNYSSVGFKVVEGVQDAAALAEVDSGKLRTAAVSKSFTLAQKNYDGEPIVVKTDASYYGLTNGYIGVNEAHELIGKQFTAASSWVTLDGVCVTNCPYGFDTTDHKTVAWQPLYDGYLGTEKLYVSMSVSGADWWMNDYGTSMEFWAKVYVENSQSYDWVKLQRVGETNDFVMIMPAGNWNKIQIARCNMSFTKPAEDANLKDLATIYNFTTPCSLDQTKNYLTLTWKSTDGKEVTVESAMSIFPT